MLVEQTWYHKDGRMVAVYDMLYINLIRTENGTVEINPPYMVPSTSSFYKAEALVWGIY